MNAASIGSGADLALQLAGPAMAAAQAEIISNVDAAAADAGATVAAQSDNAAMSVGAVGGVDLYA
jgi:hypothetical protein